MHLDGTVQGGTGQSQMGPRAGMRMPPAARKRMLQRQRQQQMQPQRGTRDYSQSAAHLVALMDQYGLEKAIVMPPPQAPQQKGGYGYWDLLPALEGSRGRLVLGAGGGVLNPLIAATDPSNVSDTTYDLFFQEATQIAKSGAKVFGEMTAMHLCLNPKHHYEASPADHPLFLALADVAAEFNIPIDLHMEAVKDNVALPQRLAEACAENPEVLPATIPGLERLLEHNRAAKIVWQHIGWDNTGEMTPELLRGLLKKHANLFLAIKGTPTPKQFAQPNRIHNDQGVILPEWVTLIEEFSERIVVGADEFARASNAQGGYRKPPFFEQTWKAIQSLPPELRQKVGRDNAARIYNL